MERQYTRRQFIEGLKKVAIAAPLLVIGGSAACGNDTANDIPPEGETSPSSTENFDRYEIINVHNQAELGELPARYRDFLLNSANVPLGFLARVSSLPEPGKQFLEKIGISRIGCTDDSKNQLIIVLDHQDGVNGLRPGKDYINSTGDWGQIAPVFIITWMHDPDSAEVALADVISAAEIFWQDGETIFLTQQPIDNSVWGYTIIFNAGAFETESGEKLPQFAVPILCTPGDLTPTPSKA